MLPLKATLAHARRLYESGLVSIPLCRPIAASASRCSGAWHSAQATADDGSIRRQPCTNIGKRPLVRDFYSWAASDPGWPAIRDLLQRRAPCNLAIVTGPIIVVETDSLAAESEVIALGGAVLNETPTRERRAGRGRAWLFSGEPGVTNRAHLGHSQAIDVRATRGIFVVPPSVHVSGHRYRWLPGLAPWEVRPPTLPQKLRALVASSGPAPLIRTATAVSLVNTCLPATVKFRLAARPEFARLWRGEGKVRGDCSASGYDFAVARALVRDGLPDREILTALALRPGAHRKDIDYLARTVAQARGRP